MVQEEDGSVYCPYCSYEFVFNYRCTDLSSNGEFLNMEFCCKYCKRKFNIIGSLNIFFTSQKIDCEGNEREKTKK